MLISYCVAQSTTKPRAAQLIRNLAIADFFWFSAAVTESVYWIFTDEDVPAILCYCFSPLVNFMRMASLLWTTAISFDVLMSVQKRKWLWATEENSWISYRRVYYIVILVFSLPGAILNVIRQHGSGIGDSSDLGCNAGYESIGKWYDVFFTELLPISLGFFANIYVYMQVREKMGENAFPQSVRKRRRRIMYHYILVCIICWTPTMIFYLSEISGYHSSALEIIARSSLYLTGFFNFVVFGMQDPHLKRAFLIIMKKIGWCCPNFINEFETGLLHREVDKTVMFGGHIEENADISKDKKNIYRYHKLTADDKVVLYHDRPDLDPKVVIGSKKSDSRSNARRKNRSIDIAKVKNAANRDFNDDEDEESGMGNGSNSISSPLLTDSERENYSYDDQNNNQRMSQSSASSADSSQHSLEDILAAGELSPDTDSSNCDGSANCEELADFSPVKESVILKDGKPCIPCSEKKALQNKSSVNFNDSAASRESDVILHDANNPAVAHVRLTHANRRNTDSMVQKNNRPPNAAGAGARPHSRSNDGPMVPDDELARRVSHEEYTIRQRSYDSAGSGGSGAVSFGARSTNNTQDGDSSGDEADEEDLELAEQLSSPSSFLLRSP